MGIRFYSRLPVGFILPGLAHLQPVLERIAPLLALVSIVMALVPAIIFLISILLGLPLLLSAVFAIVAQVVVTGAMAEDGLADSVDGLWGGNNTKDRLRIMKESTLGTYGVLAIVLLVGAKIATLSALATGPLSGAILLWISSQVLARQSALWLVYRLSPIRNEGAAASAGEISGRAFLVGIAAALAVTIIFSIIFVGVGGMIITAAIVMLIIVWWTRLCKNLIGGYSGDLIGGLQALIEIGILSGFVLFI